MTTSSTYAQSTPRTRRRPVPLAAHRAKTGQTRSTTPPQTTPCTPGRPADVLTPGGPAEANLHRQLAEELAALPGSRRLVARNETVYSVGNRDSCLYLIRSGGLKTSVVMRTGKSCLLDVHRAGELVGEGVLISDRRAETAVALTDSVLQVITRDQLRTALTRRQVQEAYVLWLTERLQQRQETIAALVTFDCQQRLAYMLYQLSRKLGIRRGGDVTVLEHRLTQEEFADMVGTTRSRIGVFLKNFKSRGLVSTKPGGPLVVHESALRNYIEQYL
ncbi:cyclic nucleotide-binding domain-containing protein [Micromonospora haikouensis]|uniref:Crp/Fnr family transcriptional regulator n=1 Tax=Micromonospora haikouensis TaxID=686309 RepID=UPI0037B25AC9